MNPDPIQQLILLGLSEAQAKCYWTLLSIQPATAYEIAKHAGVRNTEIYKIIHELEAQSILVPVSNEGKQSRRYAAMEPALFIEQYRRTMEKNTDYLSSILHTQMRTSQPEPVWPVASRPELLQQAEQTISGARRQILVSLYRQELNDLLAVTQQACWRRIEVILLIHGESINLEGATQYRLETAEPRHDRMVQLVADGAYALSALCMNNGSVEGSWSKQKAYVHMVQQSVHHLIGLSELMPHAPYALQQKIKPYLD